MTSDLSVAGLSIGHGVLAADDRRERPGPAGTILSAGAGLPAGTADPAPDDLARALPRPAGRAGGLRRSAVRPGGAAPADLVPAGPRDQGGQEPAPPGPVPHRPRQPAAAAAADRDRRGQGRRAGRARRQRGAPDPTRRPAGPGLLRRHA